MDQTVCRYCGIEIEMPSPDLPDGVVQLANGVAHEACVYGSPDRGDFPGPGSEAARQYQQTRARGGISGA